MRRLIYSIGVTLFLSFLVFHVTTLLTNPFYGMSVEALAQGSGSGSGTGNMKCYSVASQCFTFGCTYVTMCGNPCVVKKVDSWSEPGRCN